MYRVYSPYPWAVNGEHHHWRYIVETTFTFGIRFFFDSAEYYETSFNHGLFEEEIAFVKAYPKENGDMPFWAFEFENEELFGRMMKAYLAVILSNVNREVVVPGEEAHFL